MNLLIHKLNKNAIIPKYATEKSACFDIHACLDINSKIKAYESQDFPYMVENKEKSTTLKYTEKYGLIIQPNTRALIPTGLSFCIPNNHSIRLHPRSGLSFKNGIVLANCEGVIDEDYVEEVFVPIYNISNKEFMVKNGDRICQAELVLDHRVKIIETYNKINKKSDRIGGFGSTGK